MTTTITFTDLLKTYPVDTLNTLVTALHEQLGDRLERNAHIDDQASLDCLQALLDELHARAAVEYAGTKPRRPRTRLLNLDHLTTLVRRDSLSSQELHDIAASIDADETEFVGPGEYVWEAVRTLACQLDVSAQFLIDETLHYLGWDRD